VNTLKLLLLLCLALPLAGRAQGPPGDDGPRHGRDGHPLRERARAIMEELREEDPERFRELRALFRNDKRAFRREMGKLLFSRVGEGGEGARRPGLKLLQRLKEKEPETFARLQRLQAEDPAAFRQELREALKPHLQAWRQRHFGGARDQRELARRVQQAADSETREQLRERLREQIRADFRERLAAQRQRIQELEQRLERARERIAEREANAERYIDARLENLLDPAAPPQP